MSATTPYFIRHHLGDTPGNNGAALQNCPDIIFSTAGPPDWTPVPADPKTFLSAGSYGIDHGTHIQVGPDAENFVYLRALNTDPSGNVPARFWFMAAESSVVLWPHTWRSDCIKVGQKAQNWQDGKLILSGGPGPCIVTGQPFVWSPAPAASDTRYCPIAMVEPFPGADPKQPLSDPPGAPPAAIAQLDRWDQFAAFLACSDWVGWRNSMDVSRLGATWQQTIPFTSANEAGEIMIGIACSNMPTDGYVAAYMQGPDPQSTLNLPKTPISTPNMQLSMALNLPANYQTNMILTYWQGWSASPHLANIAPCVWVPAGRVEPLLRGRAVKRAPRYVRVLDNVTHESLRWQRAHMVGSAAFVWDTPPAPKKALVGYSMPSPEVVGSVKDGGATWQHSYPVTAPSGGAFYAGYQCTDMPTDGRVALDVIGPRPDRGVVLPPTAITSPNQTGLVLVQWPTGAKGTMTISYWQGATPPPAAAEIAPLVVVPDAKNPAGLGFLPTWQRTYPVTGPDESATVMVGVQWANMPTDGFVAMSLEPGNVDIPKTNIASPTGFIAQPFTMRANYQGDMVISYWRGATTPPMGASIEPFVSIVEPGGVTTSDKKGLPHQSGHGRAAAKSVSIGRGDARVGPGARPAPRTSIAGRSGASGSARGAAMSTAVSTANPYFIRHQLGDTPGNNGGAFSACPDVIVSTSGPPSWTPTPADPRTFLTTASYNTDYGSTIQVGPGGIGNFVYLRALNTNPSANVPARFWLMYTESNLALWPQNWRSDRIRVGQNLQNWQDGNLILSGGPGPYIVTAQPFLWSPPPPTGGNHYCTITMVEPFPGADPAHPLSNPPFAPPSSIGAFTSFDQLAAFVLANDWFGWRNSINVSSLGPTWQQTIPITCPSQGGQILVGVQCTNMPTDGFIAAYMQGPDVPNTLNLPKTPISTPNMLLATDLTLPANYRTSMIITYWQGPTTPPYSASIAPFLGVAAGRVEGLLRGRAVKRAPRDVPLLDKATNALSGSQRAYVIGAVSLVWETPPARS